MQPKNGSSGEDGHPHHGRTYLITDDIRPLFAVWAAERRLVLPSPVFFAEMAGRIAEAASGAIGAAATVCTITLDMLADRIASLVRTHAPDIPIVTIERSLASVSAPGQLCLPFDATRRVVLRREQWEKLGVGPRPGCAPLDVQAAVIARAVRSRGCSEVAVVDDGIYAGESLEQLIGHLEGTGVRVRCAIVGIRNVMDVTRTLETPVHHVIRFEPDELHDWVCARDFIIGCPEGGRVVSLETNGSSTRVPEYGAPYLHGLGNAVDWASIPEKAARSFTAEALAIALALYQQIGALSNRSVLMRDLARWPCTGAGPIDCDPDEWVVAMIGSVLGAPLPIVVEGSLRTASA